jgi:P27 family predicted phage terminase small subunit
MAGYKGKQGRKPIPTTLRIVRGNPGKRPLPKDEPKPVVGLPNPPDHLTAEAKREWWRMGRRLVKLGIMTEIDKAGLAVYCQTWARWEEAEAKIREVDDVMPGTQFDRQRQQFVKQAAEAMRDLMRYLVEFGMTPSSRSRVHTTKPVEAADPVEEWMHGSKRTP